EQEWLVFRSQAVDAEILDDEAAAADLHAEASDRQLALEPVGAGGFRPALQCRAKIDGQRRHHDYGDDDANRDREPARVSVDRLEERFHYSTTSSTAPASTDWPSRTDTSRTRPSRAAFSSFSIFMASTTTRPWRAL